MSLKPGLFSLAQANRPFKIDQVGPFKLLRMLSAPAGAVVSIRTVEKNQASPFVEWKLDDVLTLDLPATGFFVISTVAGAFSFQWSLNDKLQTVTTQSGGGGGPIIVVGSYQNFTPTPVDPTTPDVLNFGAFSGAGPGMGVNIPLGTLGNGTNTTQGFSSLSVGEEDVVRNITLAAPGGSVFSIAGMNSVVFTVSGAWAGSQPLLIGGVASPEPLPFWDIKGNYYPDGLIPVNGTYYTNISGQNSMGVDYPIGGAGDLVIDFLIGPKSGAPITLVDNIGVRDYDITTGTLSLILLLALGNMPDVAGFKYVVWGYIFSLDAAVDFTFVTNLTNVPLTATGFGVIGGFEEGVAIFETPVGKGVSIRASGTAEYSGQVRFKLVPVSV